MSAVQAVEKSRCGKISGLRRVVERSEVEGSEVKKQRCVFRKGQKMRLWSRFNVRACSSCASWRRECGKEEKKGRSW